MIKLTTLLKTSAIGISFVGTAIFGAHEFTKQTMADALGVARFVDPSDDPTKEEAWKKLKEKIKKDQTDSSPKTQLFKEAKASIDQDEKVLQNLCFSLKTKTYSSFLQQTKHEFLDDIKNFCSIKIEELLNGKKFAPNTTEDSGTEKDSTDKDKIKEKVKSLASHTNTHGNLDETLENLKTKISDEDSWKHLLKWCEARYQLFYKNNQEDVWKLVNRYCKKDS